jgi:chromosome segregation ATPase
MRSYVASFCVLVGAVWLAADQQRRDWVIGNSKPTVQAAGDSVRNGYEEIAKKVKNLDANSSRVDLDDAKRELASNLNRAKDKATADYVEAKAQLDRINAAERWKDAQEKLEQLRQTGKHLSQTADETSKAAASLQKECDSAKTAYESAKARVAQLLP